MIEITKVIQRFNEILQHVTKDVKLSEADMMFIKMLSVSINTIKPVVNGTETDEFVVRTAFKAILDMVSAHSLILVSAEPDEVVIPYFQYWGTGEGEEFEGIGDLI